MALLADDQSVAQRVLDHIANGTTDTGQRVWREPVENYRSPSRLQAELALFRRFPTPFCPAAALPERGSYLAREAAGTPIVAVRGSDGRVRAFRNACRHRGMLLADGAGCAKALTCRYHGWAYGLDGTLNHVPHERGFPGLDKNDHGLVPVRAEERNGLVYVTQDAPAIADDSPSMLPALLDRGQQMFSARVTELDANWKLLLEGFIEGYHIRSTHPESFLPYGFDNLNVIDVFGRCSRVTYPFQRIRKLANVPPQQRRVDGLLTYAYQLFPNVMLIVLSRHTTMIVLDPIAVDRTRMHTWALANDPGEEALAEAKRDAAFVGDTGLEEDRAVVRAIQRGLSSGANAVFTYGLYESAIVHFHATLEAVLREVPA